MARASSEAVPEQVQATIDLFISKIFADDPLTMVVKAHLYIESALLALLKAYLEKPEILETDRLTFPSKVQLGIALGLIEPQLEEVLIKLNRLRNRFVHNLEARLGKHDAFDLMGSLELFEQKSVGYQLKKLGAHGSTHMEIISMVFIWLYSKLVLRAHGLELLRTSGLSRDEMVKKMQEIA